MDESTTSDGMPQDLTAAESGAIALHEMYVNLRKAGFTMEEAIHYLVELGQRARGQD